MNSIYNRMTKPEREVADYLKERNLRWEFEFPVFVYNENQIPRLFLPDFYIPQLGLFIEVCGSKKFDYEYREKIYEKNGIPVVFLHYYKQRVKWKSFLAKRVAEIEQYRKSEAKKLAKFHKS